MNFESKVMEMIHKIREEHYKNTKKKSQKDIEESIKKEVKINFKTWFKIC
jgi:hypothetical protein